VTPGRLALLAHELRSPVAALAALAERAARAGLDADTTARLLALARAAARDVERLLSDPDLVSVRPAPVTLDALVEGLARPGVDLDVERLTLACDATRVRQALANLVENGLRHGTRVEVSARAADGWAAIEVSDDGPGVAPGLDPFARGVSGAGSTGYGLWLARAVAQAHGGSLELVPGGAGARFRLVLPLASGGSG
jgi:signal transduction histidine kinase